MYLNIMMDPRPMYPDMYHPQATNFTRDWKDFARRRTRTARPVKYYLIVFGLSREYDVNDAAPRGYPIWGGDKTVPEFQESDEPCDPFPTDIYYLGSMIRQDFLQKLRGFEFMEPLVRDMVQQDPTQRPTINEVVIRLKALCDTLPWWVLRSRVLRAGESPGLRVLSSVRHRFRTVVHVLTFRCAATSTPVSITHVRYIVLTTHDLCSVPTERRTTCGAQWFSFVLLLSALSFICFLSFARRQSIEPPVDCTLWLKT